MMKYKQVGGTRQTLPKAWTLKDGIQTGNFYLLPEAIHNAEGWFQCLDDPVVDTPTTHKLGVDTLVGNKWQRAVVEKTPEEMASDLDEKNTFLKSYAKDKAYRLIVAAIPEWKQRNLSARAIELQEIRFEGGSLTAAETLELQDIRSVFVDTVKTIRLSSDIIEAEIDAGKVTTIDQIENHIEWEA